MRQECGLQHVKKALEEDEGGVGRTAVALVRNVCRYPQLHPLVGTDARSEAAVGGLNVTFDPPSPPPTQS